MAEELQQSLVNDLLKTRRSDRLWRNIRSMLWALIVLFYAFLIFGTHKGSKTESGPYVAVVRLTGAIMPDQHFSVRRSLPIIKHAFADKKARGVILLINSPGGSATQSSIIHDRLIEFKKKYQKRLIVVGEDSLASGAYLIASAADKIFVNRDTLTGSIGVVMSGFGFVDAIRKLGITRRVFTAGTNKARLDPFTQLAAKDSTKIKNLLSVVHNGFIKDVIDGRGKRLKGDKDKLFSGDFWAGTTAVELGLADGVADIWTVMQKEFKVDHGKYFSEEPSLVNIISKTIGASLPFGLTNTHSPLREQAY